MIKKTAEINIKSDADKAAKGISNIKKDLREANMALIEAQNSFGDYSQEAINAARKVAELKDRIQEAKETAGLFDPGAKFQAFGGALNAVAGGFSVVTGAMGALGAESEDVEEMLLRVNSAMALTTGLSAVADSAKDFKRLGSIASGALGQIKTAASATFTGIKGGIAATGIGIFLIALGTIVANWDDIKKSVTSAFPALNNIGNIFNKIKEIAFGAGEVIKAYVLAPFKALGKVFQGDFKGALAEMKNGTNVVANFQKGAEKERQAQADEAAKIKLEKEITANEKSLEVQKAAGKDTYNTELAILKKKQKLYADDKEKLSEIQQEILVLNATHNKKLSDEAKSASDKAEAKRKADAEKALAEQNANNEAYKSMQNKLQDDIENLEDDNAQKKLDRQKERELEEINSLKGKTEAELQILRDAAKKKYDILQDNLDAEEKLKDEKDKKDLEDNLNKTNSELQAEIDKNTKKKTLSEAQSIDELNALYTQLQTELDAKQAALVTEFQNKQAADLLAYEAEYGQSEGYYALKEEQGAKLNSLIASQGQEDADLKQQFSDTKKKIDDTEEADQKKKVAAIGQTLETASALLGEHTLAGKALAIAATTISTYQSAVDGYKGMVAAIPGPVGIAAGAVAAAASIASGLATVKKIVSTKVPSKKGGGGAGGAGGISTPPKPSVSFQNTPQTQAADAIESASQNRNAQPIRTYVVASDVATADSLDRNRIEGARF